MTPRYLIEIQALKRFCHELSENGF